MKQLVVKKEDLKYNINIIKEFANKNNPNKQYTIIGVVKGNGYGFDLIKYSKFLVENGIEYIAVATLDEAVKLAKEHICNNILLMSVLNNKDEIEEAIKENIIVTVDSPENASIINELAKKGYNIRVHIKIDTGFGRYGFVYSDIDNIIAVINNLKSNNVNVEGIFSHLSDAYQKNNKHTIGQFEAFKNVLDKLEENKIDIPLKHICNSSAFLKNPEMHLNSCRIGSAFVGRVCAENNIGLKKIGELEISIAEVKEVPKNFSISYLDTYKTKRNSKIAVIPIGYLDGYHIAQKVDMFRFSDKLRRTFRDIKSFFKKQKLTVVVNEKKYDIIGTIRNVSYDN